jgi:hypothetical protein
MPQFTELRNLAANDIEPCPPSWPLVYHLQSGGKYWLGQYLKQLAQPLAYDRQKNISEIGELYIVVSEALKRFMEFNIAEGKNETEIQRAAGWLEEAYHADERILEKFVSLRNTL